MGGFKSKRHVREGDRLDQWLRKHKDLPVLVTGDFNAPYYSHNLNLQGMTNAHRNAGVGWHLTFPAAFPVVALDHTLGNEKIEFYIYETYESGCSTHKAQIARFSTVVQQDTNVVVR